MTIPIEKPRFTIQCPPILHNKVSAIKAIRSLTGLGLKEAKDISEIAGRVQTLHLAGGLSDTYVQEQVRILRSEGITVSEPVVYIIEELRKLGAQAMVQGEDELANEILQLVLAEKLRRQI